MRLVLGAILCALIAAAQPQVPAPCLDRPLAERPYSRVRLIAVVSDQGPNRAEYLIRACGVRVPFTADLEADLKEAGAEENVIRAVREVAPRPEPPNPPPEATAGQIATNSKDGLRYVHIPPGRFKMGCSDGDSDCFSDEQPAHEVRITKGFWIGQTEVAVEAYKRYADSTSRSLPYEAKLLDGNPMTDVSWTESRNYCEWAGLRLPTEAEWEYAARAGSGALRYGPIEDIAWYNDNSGRRSHAVAQKQANAFKLYDMIGNVLEWTADWYQDSYYAEGPRDDPQGPQSGELRVLRGGSWSNPPRMTRLSNRDRGRPSGRSNAIGFRCVGEKIVP